MNNTFYENKYLKYKKKYIDLKEKIEMKGGLIGQIPIDRLNELKAKEAIPQQIKNYVKLMTIPNTEIIRVGSSINKIQPFYSDVDVMNVVFNSTDTESTISFFIENLKKIVENLSTSKINFFSDFKAGGIHWKLTDIQNEKNGSITLRDACKIKETIKLDMIVPYDERYLEMSTFFVLKSTSGFINVNANYFSSLSKSLLKDIADYKTTKPFKAIKRAWSLGRIRKDYESMDKIKDLIKSNIALLAQINADIETIELLIQHGSNYNLEFVINEINSFKERLSNILDIKFDDQKANIMIENLILLFRFNLNTNEHKTELLESLSLLHNYLLEIINRETNEYINYTGYTFPTENNDEIDIDLNTGMIKDSNSNTGFWNILQKIFN